MKLSYRGINYETTSAQPQQTAPVVPVTDLHYRGATYRLGQAAKSEALEAIVKQRTAPAVNLTYRGATYRLNQAANTEALQTVFKEREATFNQVDAQGVQAQPQAPVLSIEDKARALVTNHQRAIRNRQMVMLNRTAIELGLAANVANYWNRIQGQIHPTFRLTYDRSHATLS